MYDSMRFVARIMPYPRLGPPPGTRTNCGIAIVCGNYSGRVENKVEKMHQRFNESWGRIDGRYVARCGIAYVKRSANASSCLV